MTLASGAARAAVILFWLATSAYAFLTSVPFVYEQFLEPGLVPSLVRFAAWHGWLMLGAALLTGLAVWPDIRDRRATLVSGVLLWAAAMAGVAAVVGEPMRALRPGTTALWASLLALVPVAWLAAIDLRLAPWTDAPRATDMTGRDALVAGASALSVLVVESLLGVATIHSAPGLGVAQSLGAHLLLFAAVFSALAAVRGAADLTTRPALWEAVGAVSLLGALVGSAATLVIVPTLSIAGWPARAAVFTFGATIAAVLAARGLRLGRARERDGVVLATSGLLPRWAQSRRVWPRVGWAATVIAVAVLARFAAGAMDWNFAVAKLGVIAIWLLVLATALQWAPAHVRLHPVAPFLACAVVVALYLGTAGRLPGGPVTLEAATSAADTWVVGRPVVPHPPRLAVSPARRPGGGRRRRPRPRRRWRHGLLRPARGAHQHRPLGGRRAGPGPPRRSQPGAVGAAAAARLRVRRRQPAPRLPVALQRRR